MHKKKYGSFLDLNITLSSSVFYYLFFNKTCLEKKLKENNKINVIVDSATDVPADSACVAGRERTC